MIVVRTIAAALLFLAWGPVGGAQDVSVGPATAVTDDEAASLAQLEKEAAACDVQELVRELWRARAIDAQGQELKGLLADAQQGLVAAERGRARHSGARDTPLEMPASLPAETTSTDAEDAPTKSLRRVEEWEELVFKVELAIEDYVNVPLPIPEEKGPSPSEAREIDTHIDELRDRLEELGGPNEETPPR